eukprot:Nk52_evm1s342 gene=Nk52_evmTU1s342
MLYNSKLSGALFGLAFLACLFMVSSAENIQEHQLKGTASEGGLKNSPNDALQKPIYLLSMTNASDAVRPYCVYNFEDGKGNPCPLSNKGHYCVIELKSRLGPVRLGLTGCPKVKHNIVHVSFWETVSLDRYDIQLHSSTVSIEGFPKVFRSKVITDKARKRFKTADKFNGYELNMAYQRRIQ